MGFTPLSSDEALAAGNREERAVLESSGDGAVPCGAMRCQVRSVLGRLALDWPGTGGLAESMERCSLLPSAFCAEDTIFSAGTAAASATSSALSWAIRLPSSGCDASPFRLM